MLVLAFGPFAFVEMVTLGFSWGWAVWGWRMFHISVPVAPQGRGDSGEELGWELWAHVSTTFPPGDYCSTCISMLCCTTDSVFSWQQLLILWPRGLPTPKSQTESQTWDRNCSKDRSVLFVSLGLGYFVKLHQFCSCRRSCSGAEGTACWRVPARTSSLESSLRIVWAAQAAVTSLHRPCP